MEGERVAQSLVKFDLPDNLQTLPMNLEEVEVGSCCIALVPIYYFHVNVKKNVSW